MPPKTQRRALTSRPFLVYTVANGISSLGLWVQRLAIGWLSWQLTHSEIWVGLIAFSLMGPTLLFSPFFGVMVDRYEPLRTATAINLLTMVWAVALAILSIAGALSIYVLLAISLLIGTTSAAYTPTRISVLPALVPRDLLPNAIGVSAMIYNGTRLLGPAIAGAVLVALPISAAFLINAVTYLPLIFALALVERRKTAPRQHEPFFTRFIEGIRYSFSHPFVGMQLLLTAWNALFGRSVLELLPVYSDRLYGAAAGGLAVLSGAAGAGALVAAYFSAQLDLNSRQMQFGSATLAILNSITLMLLPCSNALWFGAICIAVVGFGSTGSAVLSQTVVQVEIEDHFRGRVSSLWGMASLGGSAFGGLTLGFLLTFLGVSGASVVSALLSLIVPIAAWRQFRKRLTQAAD